MTVRRTCTPSGTGMSKCQGGTLCAIPIPGMSCRARLERRGPPAGWARRGPAAGGGPRGPQGPEGPRGQQGAIGKWTSMENVQFESGRAEIQAKCADKIAKLATWMNENRQVVIAL